MLFMFRPALLGLCAVVLLFACEKTEKSTFNFYVETTDTFKIRRNTTTVYPITVYISDGQPQDVSIGFADLPENVKVPNLTIFPQKTDTLKFNVYQAATGTFPVKISAYSAATGAVVYDKWLIISN